jgi:hypothetical protein
MGSTTTMQRVLAAVSALTHHKVRRMQIDPNVSHGSSSSTAVAEDHVKACLRDLSTHLLGLGGPFHDSGKSLCVTQLAGLHAAHLIHRPFPYLPHAFATRVRYPTPKIVYHDQLGHGLPDGGKEVMPRSVGYPNDGGER